MGVLVIVFLLLTYNMAPYLLLITVIISKFRIILFFNYVLNRWFCIWFSYTDRLGMYIEIKRRICLFVGLILVCLFLKTGMYSFRVFIQENIANK